MIEGTLFDQHLHIDGIVTRKGSVHWRKGEVNYNVIDGLWIYQGDMVIGNEIDGVDDNKQRRRRLNPYVNETGDAWPNGIVYYEFDSSMSTTFDQDIWDKAIADFETKTPLRFVQRTAEPDYISIYYGSGCNSYVGYGSGARTMSLGNNCFTVRVIVHEIGHAVGLHHTQSRSDRDNYITINYGNVESGSEDNFEIKQGWPICGYYDFTSIMQYGETANSYNGEALTIEAINPANQDLLIQHSCQRLTANDIDCINNYIYYFVTANTPTPTITIENVNNLQLLYNDDMSNTVNTGWNRLNDQYIYTQYISSFCPNINMAQCTAMAEKSLLYKTFSTVGYSDIKVFYDIAVGVDNSLDQSDLFLIYYSCSNSILHLVANYTGEWCTETHVFDLPQDCYNTNDLIIYFYSLTSSSTMNEITTLNNLKLYGENNLNYDTTQSQYILFEDNMNDYTINWNVISDFIDTTSSFDYCGILPSCTEFYDNGGITLKTPISTVGYKDIILIFDLNVGPDGTLDAPTDTFSVFYSCDGTTPSVLLQEYSGQQVFKNESFALPSECDNVNNLDLRFIHYASNEVTERTYLNNIYVIGDSTTQMPTRTPTAPSESPTGAPTSPTVSPTNIPTNAPVPTLAPVALIASDTMDDCSLSDWTIVYNEAYVDKCYSSTDCLSTSDICTSIKEQTLIYRTFNVEGYSSIILEYDISIGAENSIEAANGDKFEIYYECSNYLIKHMITYSNSNDYMNEQFEFPSECDDTDHLVLYYISDTSASSQNERGLISDITLSGYIGSNPTNEAMNIFHDDMSDYTRNWIKITDTLSTVSTLDVCTFTFAYPPCIDFNIDGELESNDISTIGYEQIDLYYDVNIVPNNVFEAGEKFQVFYSCDGSTPYVLIQEYTSSGVYANESFSFPSNCDNINNLKLSYKISGSSSEHVYLRNVNILGMLINGITDKPTDFPSENPSQTPTSDTNQPSKTPSDQPSDNPSDQPTYQPSQNPSNQPSTIPTNQPSDIPTEAPSKNPSRTGDTEQPSSIPSNNPSSIPSDIPSNMPSSPHSAIVVITRDNMDDCLLTDWIIGYNSNNVEACYSSSECLSTSSICTSIKEETMIYKVFSTSGYSSIILNYDINIGPDNTLEDYNNDQFIIYYSCNNYLIKFMKSYTGSGEYYDEEFEFPSDCDNTDHLILYFVGDTSSGSQNERALISDIILYGYISTTSTPIDNVFHDDMVDYTINWLKIGDTISTVPLLDTFAIDCMFPPCIAFNVDGEIISNDISTIGYEQLDLFYDINIVPNNVFEVGNDEKFQVFYSCDGSTLTLIQEYTVSAIHLNESFSFPSLCDNINNLRLSYKIVGSSSEFVYLRNINILGIYTQTITDDPTKEPSDNATDQPSASAYPSLNPTSDIIYETGFETTSTYEPTTPPLMNDSSASQIVYFISLFTMFIFLL